MPLERIFGVGILWKKKALYVVALKSGLREKVKCPSLVSFISVSRDFRRGWYAKHVNTVLFTEYHSTMHLAPRVGDLR